MRIDFQWLANCFKQKTGKTICDQALSLCQHSRPKQSQAQTTAIRQSKLSFVSNMHVSVATQSVPVTIQFLGVF